MKIISRFTALAGAAAVAATLGLGACGSTPAAPHATATATAQSAVTSSRKPAADPNVAALKIVQKFDAQSEPSPPNGDWEAFTAPLETASGMATDQTLSTDILTYHNDLVGKGTEAYGDSESDALTAIAKGYGVNIWPNG